MSEINSLASAYGGTQQVAQTSTPPLNPAPLTADEIRNKILETFKRFEPHAQAYHDYAEQVSSLSVAYHDQRIRETLCLPEEGVLVTTLNAAETPKSLDTKLAQIKALPGTTIKRVLFDRTKGCYYLFA
jgi:hypothetical protein